MNRLIQRGERLRVDLADQFDDDVQRRLQRIAMDVRVAVMDEVKDATKTVLLVDARRLSRADAFEDFDDLLGEIFVRAIFDVDGLQAGAHRSNDRVV